MARLLLSFEPLVAVDGNMRKCAVDVFDNGSFTVNHPNGNCLITVWAADVVGLPVVHKSSTECLMKLSSGRHLNFFIGNTTEQFLAMLAALDLDTPRYVSCQTFNRRGRKFQRGLSAPKSSGHDDVSAQPPDAFLSRRYFEDLANFSDPPDPCFPDYLAMPREDALLEGTVEASSEVTEQQPLTAVAEVASEDVGVNEEDELTKPFDMADVTFLVQDKPIYSNRTFLAMHSGYFKGMLFGENAKREEQIKIEGHRFVDFLAMLKLLKSPQQADSGRQIITSANVEKLLELAEIHQLPLVTALCENFLLTHWKFDSCKFVPAVKLAAKFGLHTALRDLLAKPAANYPSLLTDDNLAPILEVAKEFQLEHINAECEKYLLQNWKQRPDKVVQAVELSAKFGLEKALANLLKNASGPKSPIITDANVEQLLDLCEKYSLFEVRADCEQYVMQAWAKRGDKALRAVEIAHKMRLSNLARAFIPLAASRPLREIDASMPNLSTELYCAILHGFRLAYNGQNLQKMLCSACGAHLSCSECCYSAYSYTHGPNSPGYAASGKLATKNDPVVEEMLKRAENALKLE